jgi:predicted nucleic acid-binding protein
MKRVFFDANIWLDVALQNPGLWEASKQSLESVGGEAIEAWVAWHTLSNGYYIVNKRADHDRAIDFVRDILASATVAPVGHREALRAAGLEMNDLEDAMQIACAEACAADAIVTRNVTDFKISTIPVYTPEDFVAAFAPPISPP